MTLSVVVVHSYCIELLYINKNLTPLIGSKKNAHKLSLRLVTKKMLIGSYRCGSVVFMDVNLSSR